MKSLLPFPADAFFTVLKALEAGTSTPPSSPDTPGPVFSEDRLLGSAWRITVDAESPRRNSKRRLALDGDEDAPAALSKRHLASGKQAFDRECSWLSRTGTYTTEHRRDSGTASSSESCVVPPEETSRCPAVSPASTSVAVPTITYSPTARSRSSRTFSEPAALVSYLPSHDDQPSLYDYDGAETHVSAESTRGTEVGHDVSADGNPDDEIDLLDTAEISGYLSDSDAEIPDPELCSTQKKLLAEYQDLVKSSQHALMRALSLRIEAQRVVDTHTKQCEILDLLDSFSAP